MRYDSRSFLVVRVHDVLESALTLFWNDPAWQGRTGGYFCLADLKTGLPDFVFSVGDVRLEKAEKYWRFCQEKPRRLASHPEHLSSWESRNPELEQYGGAVRLGDSLFSFSGLPELGDEAMMLLVGGMYYTSHINWAQPVIYPMRKIAEKSKNPYYSPLFEAACKVSGYESFVDLTRPDLRR